MVEKALGEGRPLNEAGSRFVDKRLPLRCWHLTNSPEGLTLFQRNRQTRWSSNSPPYWQMKLPTIAGRFRWNSRREPTSRILGLK